MEGVSLTVSVVKFWHMMTQRQTIMLSKHKSATKGQILNDSSWLSFLEWAPAQTESRLEITDEDPWLLKSGLCLVCWQVLRIAEMVIVYYYESN